MDGFMTTVKRLEYSGLRSFLFTPGNHPRRVQKVFVSGADAAILDLEDAVAIDEKVATRAMVVEALKNERRSKGYVRINSLGTDFWEDCGRALAGRHRAAQSRVRRRSGDS